MRLASCLGAAWTVSWSLFRDEVKLVEDYITQMIVVDPPVHGVVRCACCCFIGSQMIVVDPPVHGVVRCACCCFSGSQMIVVDPPVHGVVRCVCCCFSGSQTYSTLVK